MLKSLLPLFVIVCSFASLRAAESQDVQADVIIYGGTPAGVTAAYAAAGKGLSVVVVEMNNHVGGMVSGGLVETDIGDRRTVGGAAEDFFKRIVAYYSDKYGPASKQVAASRNGLMFEPSAAEIVYDQMLAEKKVQVFKRHRLASVEMNTDGNIAAFTADDLAKRGQRKFSGKIFIDASYEGDLMAEAGVKQRIGREARDEYGESLAGISVGPDKGKADGRYQSYNYRISITGEPGNVVPFPKPDDYDPFWAVNFGDRIKRLNLKEFSDLLIGGAERAGPNGKYDLNWGDLAAANEGYADGDWAKRDAIAKKYHDHFLSGLWYLQNDPSLPKEWLENMKHWGLPKDEFVDNGNFPFQLYVRQARRMVGEYVLTEKDLTQNRYKPDAICAGSYGVDCHAVREVTVDKKKVMDLTPHYYVSGYDIPYATLVPKDEPGQPKNLLVPVCLSTTHVAYCSVRMEPVYMMLGQAAGNAAWLAIKNGLPVQKVDVKELRDILRKEGAVLDANFQPQVKIAWQPSNPKPGENVKFTLVKAEARAPLEHIWWDFEGNGKVSATGETADATFRQDKVYNVSALVEDKDHRRMWATAEVPVGKAEKTDVTIDEFDAEKTGRWDGTFPKNQDRGPDVFMGPGMRYELVVGEKARGVSAIFQPDLPKPGRYEVCLAFRPASGQAKNAKLLIRHAGGETEVKVDQTRETTPFPFVSLGEFKFDKGAQSSVTLTNSDNDGRLVMDGMRWIYRGK